MRGDFHVKRKKNFTPFLILTFVHMLLLFFTFYKNKDRKRLFLLLMSNVGLAYLFEYIVLNLFQAYRYRPKLLKQKYLDNIFGAVLSQAIIIPFTGVFITAQNLKWRAKLFFIFYFNIIEFFFISQKVYKVMWWKPIYTSIGLPVFFSISDYWYKGLKAKKAPLLFITLYLCILVVGVNLMYIFAVLRKFRFGIGSWHTWKEHFIIAPLYSIILSLYAAWAIKKNTILAKVSVLVFGIGMDWIVYKVKLVKQNFKVSWFNTAVHIFMIMVASFFKKIIYDKLPQNELEK